MDEIWKWFGTRRLNSGQQDYFDSGVFAFTIWNVTHIESMPHHTVTLIFVSGFFIVHSLSLSGIPACSDFQPTTEETQVINWNWPAPSFLPPPLLTQSDGWEANKSNGIHALGWSAGLSHIRSECVTVIRPWRGCKE